MMTTELTCYGNVEKIDFGESDDCKRQIVHFYDSNYPYLSVSWCEQHILRMSQFRRIGVAMMRTTYGIMNIWFNIYPAWLSITNEAEWEYAARSGTNRYLDRAVVTF